LCVSGGDKLIRLGNVFTPNQPLLQPIPELPGLEYLLSRQPIWGKTRIGDRQATEPGIPQIALGPIDLRLPRHPQHQPSDGVGKATAGDSNALDLQSGRARTVGGEKDIELGAIADLRIVFAG
jgi:hypothetical protein